jgi:hypothetical protein
MLNSTDAGGFHATTSLGGLHAQIRFFRFGRDHPIGLDHSLVLVDLANGMMIKNVLP